MVGKRIVILNGDLEPKESPFSRRVDELAKGLSSNCSVSVFPLREMNLHYCTGCWSCWWKTPGECAIKDDAEEIFRSVINSNLLLFASPLMAGFTSSRLKMITDRLIVLLHPYLQVIGGECHHQKRYDKYPDFGVLLGKEADTDDEDMTIVKDIYDRLAINLHSKQLFCSTIDEFQADGIVCAVGEG